MEFREVVQRLDSGETLTIPIPAVWALLRTFERLGMQSSYRLNVQCEGQRCAVKKIDASESSGDNVLILR